MVEAVNNPIITGDGGFLQACVDCNEENLRAILERDLLVSQGIPTLSTWGLVVLTLGSLIAGTVILSRRREPTDTTFVTSNPR